MQPGGVANSMPGGGPLFGVCTWPLLGAAAAGRSPVKFCQPAAHACGVPPRRWMFNQTKWETEPQYIPKVRRAAAGGRGIGVGWGGWG